MQYQRYRRDWNLEMKFANSREYDDFVSNAILGNLKKEVTTEYKNIMLFAQPKSASLYFHHLLAQCLDFKQAEIGFNNGGGTLYYPRAIALKYLEQNTVSHCHSPGNKMTQKIVDNLEFKPIVLTRNILDALVSRRDMMVREARRGKTVCAQIEGDDVQRFLDMNLDEQLTVTAKIFAPEYIYFCKSWRDAQKKYGDKIFFTTYEDVTRKPVPLIQNIAKWLDVPIPTEEKINELVGCVSQNGGINFNKGLIGRGRKLKKEHIQIVQDAADLFNIKDKSFLGL